MLTKIEMETLEAIKSFCRRENKKTYVKTFEFACSRMKIADFDKTINEWISENHVTVVSLQHSVVSYPCGNYATYVLLYQKK